MKKSSYMTRAMTASDPRFARVLGKLGYERADLVAPVARDPLDHDGDGKKGGSTKQEESDELKEVRARYEEVLGKRPFHGWDVETLKAKIAEAQA